MTDAFNVVPEVVIRRLPKYYRYLDELAATGEVRISSSQMSRDLGVNASQIRRDLNCFGGFGQQGYGYNVGKLRKEIGHILGLDQLHSAVILGVATSAARSCATPAFRARGSPFWVRSMWMNTRWARP